MLHVACATVYLTMAVLVVARRPGAGLNWACGALILCFCAWSACLAVSHHPSTSPPTAELFYDLGSVAWGSFASLTVLFIAVFWRFRHLRARWFWAALVIPPAVVIHAQWTGKLAAAYPSYPWGHGFLWRDSPSATFYIAYYVLYMVGGLGALLVGSFASGPPVRRRQARIIVLSAVLPLLAGSLTDVWLPRSGVHGIPNMAPDFTVVWVLGLVYAIVRYRMLELTPAVAADRVVAIMPDALFLLQPEGRIAWANPAAAALLGRPEAALREMFIADAFQIPSPSVPARQALLRSGRRDLGVRRKDGAELAVSLSVAEIRGGLGELAGWVAVASDVTARNQAEIELRQARDTLESRVMERTLELQQVNRRLVGEISERQRSEEHYRLLIESMQEGLWVLDPEDRTTLVNPRLASILGCAPLELVGRELVDFLDEASRAACVEALRDARRGQAGQGDWQLRAWAGPGNGNGNGNGTGTGTTERRRISAIVQLSPLFDGGGYLGAVLTVMDVTERESMRAQLSRAERLASMGLLAAGVGHEINNPLTFVIGNLEEIVRMTGTEARDVPVGREAARRLAEEALAGTFRVREIVKELRRFSRADTHQVSPIDVHEAIEDAIKLAHNEIRSRARLVRELDATVPLAMANRMGLSQVVLNLLLNAGQAIGEGHPDRNEICIRTALAGERVSISVRDTGSGIRPEDLDKIFDPFFSTKPESEGQGLGLAICHELVAAAGGQILVTSTVGQGTEFVISLRASRARAEAAVGALAEPVPGPPSLASMSVSASMSAPTPVRTPVRTPAPAPSDVLPRALIVDDEDLVRRVLRRQLEGVFRVDDVASAERALALLASDPGYDVIFCDMMMPGMSGMAFAAWISEHVPDLARRIVLMTGGAFTVEAERYLEHAANPVLEKPFQTAQVRHLARDLLVRLGRRTARPGAIPGSEEMTPPTTPDAISE